MKLALVLATLFAAAPLGAGTWSSESVTNAHGTRGYQLYVPCYSDVFAAGMVASGGMYEGASRHPALRGSRDGARLVRRRSAVSVRRAERPRRDGIMWDFVKQFRRGETAPPRRRVTR